MSSNAFPSSPAVGSRSRKGRANGTALLLPNFLYPRLSASADWPAITRAETATVDSIFFVGNMCGLIFWGVFSDARGRRLATNASLLLLILP